MRHRGMRVTILASAALAGAITLIPVPSAFADTAVTEVGPRVPDVTPAGLAAGPNHTVWFAENAGGIGRVAANGNVTEYSLPANSQKSLGTADGMAADSAGRLWFTDPSWDVPRVGYIDAATGKRTVFELPTTGDVNFAGGGLTDIVRGPDGGMWFGGSGAAAIGRIDSSGTVTAYATSGLSATSLAIGPDKAVWFTTTGSSIGRLDPATGAVTTYDAPSAGMGSPSFGGITTGPDRALWFTEPGVGRIGRLSPATGEITEYPVNTADSAPMGITRGPGGTLWFTEAAASNIGTIDPGSGTVTEYPLPATLSAPMRIIAAPGGTIWFSESGTGRIGHFAASAPPSGAPHPATPAVSPGGYPRIAAKFQNQCPQGTLCQTLVNTGGSMKIGSFTLDLPPGALRVTGSPDFAEGVLHPPVAGAQLVSKPVEVPGGIIGRLPLIGPVLGMSPAAMLKVNRLTVTQTLAGPIKVQIDSTGIHTVTPLTIHLNNELLGKSCVIGPMTTSLTPTPLGGAIDFRLQWASAMESVGDKPYVPAAKGCGPGGILDGVINLMMGLPSAAANNGLTMTTVLSLGAGINPANTPAARAPSPSQLDRLLHPQAKKASPSRAMAPLKVRFKLRARH